MEPAAAKFLMALIILTRSSAFLFSKFVLEELAPFQALGFGSLWLFWSWACCSAVICSAPGKRCLSGTQELGLVCCFCVMGAECGACSRPRSTQCFLENLSLAWCSVPSPMVPPPAQCPDPPGRGLHPAGSSSLTIGTVGFTLAGGEGWALLAAVFYAGYIIAWGNCPTPRILCP